MDLALIYNNCPQIVEFFFKFLMRNNPKKTLKTSFLLVCFHYFENNSPKCEKKIPLKKNTNKVDYITKLIKENHTYKVQTL
jgi:hypothetical protein